MINGQERALKKWFEKEIRFTFQNNENQEDKESQPTKYYLLQKLANNYPNHFDKKQENSYRELLHQIEKCIQKQMGKKFKKSFKLKVQKKLSEENEKSSNFYEILLPLGLFLLINSNEKSQIINRILEMSQDEQNQLREEIQFIEDSKLQNIIETKQILEQINLLSEQNSLLAHKLKELKQKNKELTHTKQQILDENLTLWETSNQNRQEKSSIIQALNINEVEQYSEMLKSLQNKKEKYMCLIDELQSKNQSADEEIKELKKRITADESVIEQLQIEIMKYKEKLLEVQSNSILSSIESENLLDQSLKETNFLANLNTNSNNITDRVPLGIRENHDEFQNREFGVDGDFNLMKYNGELMDKCLAMQNKIRKIKQNNEFLRDKNSELQKMNKIDENKIQAFMFVQQKFTHSYKSVTNKQSSSFYLQKAKDLQKSNLTTKSKQSRKRVIIPNS